MWGPGMMGFGFGWLGGLWMLLTWLVPLAIVGFIVYAIIGANRGRTRGPEDALSILQARYARGEISTEEYRSMKQELLEK